MFIVGIRNTEGEIMKVTVTEFITKKRKSFNSLNDAALNYGVSPSGFYKKFNKCKCGNEAEFMYFMFRLLPLQVKVVIG